MTERRRLLRHAGRTLWRSLRPFGELRALLAIILVGACLWVFFAIADEVREGEGFAFDERLLLALRTAADPAVPIGPGWLAEAMRDVTALGGYTVLTLVALGTVMGLWLARRWQLAIFVTVASLGAVFWTESLKLVFARPRPDLVPHAVTVHSLSFPSGHAIAAAAVYLTLAVLLAGFQTRWRLRVFIITAAVIVILLVGGSRVYLGVHWPSDVAAGWTLGSAWALFCWLVAAWLRRRRVLPAQSAQAPSSDASKGIPAD